jgi:hypothetical protein
MTGIQGRCRKARRARRFRHGTDHQLTSDDAGRMLVRRPAASSVARGANAKLIIGKRRRADRESRNGSGDCTGHVVLSTSRNHRGVGSRHSFQAVVSTASG